MMELRRDATTDDTQLQMHGLRVNDFAWFLAPLLSLALLITLSSDLVVTTETILTVGVFYACQLGIFLIRNELGQMRNAIWDLGGPIVLGAILLGPHVLAVAAIFATGTIGWIAARGTLRTQGIADSLIMQLPSLCIAPVILILLRDVFDFRGAIPRADVETFGMIVNGTGAAAWTALVMRASSQLARLAVGLWIVGTLVALQLLFIPASAALSAVAIVGAEIFRGSLWLGVTHLLKNVSRWSGFKISLVATVLPLAAVMISHFAIGLKAFFAMYAAIHGLIPLTLWIYSRNTKRAVI